MSDEEIKETPEEQPVEDAEDQPLLETEASADQPLPKAEEAAPADEEVTDEPQAPTPATGGSRLRTYVVALGMAALGILVSAFLFITRPPPPETDPPDLDEPEWAQVEEMELVEFDAGLAPSRRPHVGRPEQVFQRLSNRITAADSPEERVDAVLEMVDFLLDADHWRPERERHIMVREYLLALAERPPEDEEQHLALAEKLLQMAAVMRERALYNAATNLLLEDIPKETIPISVLLAETDALLALAEYALAYKQIDPLSARAHTPQEQALYTLRQARGLRAAFAYPAAMEALLTHRNLSETDTVRDELLEELDALATALSLFADIELGAEGLMLRAFVAAQRDNVEKEIDALQRAIARGASSSRPQAYIQLLERLGAEGRDAEFAVLLTSMMSRPELRDRAITELHARLQTPVEPEVLRDLLQATRFHVELSTPQDPLRPALLVAAARAAMQEGWTEIATEYLDMVEQHVVDRRVQADAMLLRAQLAESRDDIHHMIYYLNEVITLYPGHPQEADIRFKLLHSLAEVQFSEADLVSSIMGAVSRVPRDQRGLDGLLLVAQRLESLDLYDQAEVYYQRVVLLSSLMGLQEVSKQVSVALLGQARCMVGLRRDADADALLRVINTNPRWTDIWHESGPLWSAIAFRHRQPREAIRRWRHTCGPPGGALLPFLFQLLVPDLAEWPQSVVIGGKPRRPPRVPYVLMEAAIDLAMEQLLQQNDYEQLDRLLTLIENDEEWKRQLPLNEYRTRCLQHLVAREPSSRILEWMERHPVSVTDEDQEEIPVDVTRLKELIGEVESASLRARTAPAL